MECGLNVMKENYLRILSLYGMWFDCYVRLSQFGSLCLNGMWFECNVSHFGSLYLYGMWFECYVSHLGSVLIYVRLNVV